MNAVENRTAGHPGAGHHGAEEVVLNRISSLDEPSVVWGWHQHSTKVGFAVGGFFAFFLLCMLVGNHVGHVEDCFLIGGAVVIVAGLIMVGLPKKDRTAKKNAEYSLPEGHYSARH